ncbi:MAG: tetraacyldisaccharide 4'-kinase [Flavobacteriales bacterium]|nr:tetraacyldisaccharide 4'-kinase [Flavobacteriales bacterium]
MTPAKLLLAPFAILYWIITSTRNFLFDKNIISSTSYDLPIICIGNLTHGGTGKTPHVMHVAKALQEKITIAVLLRGYKRESKGYMQVTNQTPFKESGDEAKQYINTNKELIVAVDTDRRNGIEQLSLTINNLGCIILDDGFQHRKVKPGYSILLREYSEVTQPNFIAPMGTMRESPSQARRAQSIIISKCPEDLSKEEQNTIRTNLKLNQYQSLFFTSIKYQSILSAVSENVLSNIEDYDIVLFTGIANATPLLKYIKERAQSVIHRSFPDHHDFTTNNISSVMNDYNDIKSDKKIILTTEKDLARLYRKIITKMNIHYIPISIHFHNNEDGEFIKQLSNFVSNSNN